jgi:hypothetical protein
MWGWGRATFNITNRSHGAPPRLENRLYGLQDSKVQQLAKLAAAPPIAKIAKFANLSSLK